MGVIIISKRDFIARTQEGADYGEHAYPHGCSKAQARRVEEKWKQRSIRNDKAAKIAADEYDHMLKTGLVRPPTDREKLIGTANGHPDNQSTQAARRLCEKKGINWRGG